MRTFVLFGGKNFKFFEIYGVPAQTRGRGMGLSQCGHFAIKEKGVNFSRFYADIIGGLKALVNMEKISYYITFYKTNASTKNCPTTINKQANQLTC